MSKMKKKASSSSVSLEKMDCKTIDPETFTFKLPASVTNRSSTRATSTASSKLLALSVYIIHTTDDFKDLTYRVTKNTDSEESLVITHGRNLGLLGENLDPVTLTLTEKGTCFLNVLFQPAEKFHLLDKTLFDAGEFIKILKRLTNKDEYLFCPGIEDVQPACFVKKLTSHVHPFSRHQSSDCTVWYKNTEGIKDKLLARCKPCRDLFKHLQTLPKKVHSKSTKPDKEKTESVSSSPRRSNRGRKRKETTVSDDSEIGESIKNINNSNIAVDKSPPTKVAFKIESLTESPGKSEKPQSPRSSRRISEKGVTFCKLCVCFHKDKDGKCPALVASSLPEPVHVEPETAEVIESVDLPTEVNTSKTKSSRGRRKVKTPVKRKSTEENELFVENDENIENNLIIEEVNVSEMDVGAHEELEFVVKQESDDDVDELPSKAKKKLKKGRKGKKLKEEASESLDELDAGASALLALNRGRKRPDSSSQSSKKPGRPRVLGNQHSAPSGIEALLTAAMTADKDDKGGSKGGKKVDNHLPTPRTKRDSLNTPFKVLMAQIESDKYAEGDGSKTWKCPECGDHYSSKASLRRHLRIHDLYRPYFCPVCDKTFVQKITLKVHMRLHSGDKPHVCSVCNRSFAQKSNMETHLRRHLGQRPYKCSLCNKGFSDKGSLGEHNKTHTGEQPYVCPICKKAFSQRANMRTHMRRHKDDRPYACGKCNKMFKNKDGYWKHITAVHKDTTLKADIPNLQTLEYYRQALDKEPSDPEDEDSKEEVEIEEIPEEDHEEVLMLIDENESEGTQDSKESVLVETIKNEVVSNAETEAAASSITQEAETSTSSPEPIESLETKETVLEAESVKPTTVSTNTTNYSAILSSLTAKISNTPTVQSSTVPLTFVRNGNQFSFVRPSTIFTKPVAVMTKSEVNKPSIELKGTGQVPISSVSSNSPSMVIRPGLSRSSIRAATPVLQQSTASLKTSSLNAAVPSSPIIAPITTLLSKGVAAVNSSPIVKGNPVISKVGPVIQTERVTVCKSSPPEGYISVNLIGSDGKPMGSRYMNPKDLGLTVSVEKSNVTKFQLSSISDEKNIVTSTIVTDPYSGKAVTIKPKEVSSLATSLSPGTSSVTVIPQHPAPPMTNIKIAPKSVFTSSIISSPQAKTIFVNSTDTNIGSRAVILDMASQNPRQSLIPVSIPATSFSQSKQTPKKSTLIKTPTTKASLKYLVNASTLKSVAEKCKASVLLNAASQSPTVKSLLKSPPLSHADISQIEEIKNLQQSTQAIEVNDKTEVETAINHITSSDETTQNITVSETKPLATQKIFLIKDSEFEKFISRDSMIRTDDAVSDNTTSVTTVKNIKKDPEDPDEEAKTESIEVMVGDKIENVTIPLT